jgi:hypothetical protein
MPLPDDRLPPRDQPLAYPEAVQLANPVEPDFKGEVYTCFFLSRFNSYKILNFSIIK